MIDIKSAPPRFILPGLLKIQLDVNSLDRQGKTTLHIAVEKGAEETVERLLAEPKTDAGAYDRKGWQPLTVAWCRHGGNEDITALIKARLKKDMLIKNRIRNRQLQVSESVGHHSTR